MIRPARSVDPDIRLLVALADPVRLSIVRQLAVCDGICACDFTEACDVSQPTVSHHLKVLREAGVVESERKGSWIFYRLSPEAIGRLGALARSLVPGDFDPAKDLGRRGRARPSSSGAMALAQVAPLPVSSTPS
ncbi:MAG: metalloregulator ArsR/SmtB family transcription factor [Candidatus Limnocylindrales bacterium]